MSDSGSSEPATLVYVEDNADNLRLVQRVLEASGAFRVLGAADGRSGLQLIRNERPVLVLLDLDLPEVSGLELARLLAADAELARIPVIAVSAHVMQGEGKAALEAGCVAFVEKPIDIAAFRRLVETHARRGR